MAIHIVDVEYEAVIFDNDGVIIEIVSGESLYSGISSAFERFGVDPSDEDVKSLMKPESSEEIEEIAGKYGLDTHKFWRERERKVSESQQEGILSGEMALYSDTEILEELDGYELGIVSTNQHRTIEFILEHFGFEEHFSTYYGRKPTPEGYDKRKPNTHYVEKALSDLGTRKALFVGDRQTDIEAAERVGIDSAFLERSHNSAKELRSNPDFVLNSLSEVKNILGE